MNNATQKTIELLNTDIDARTEAETNELRTNLRKVARAFGRGSWILLSMVMQNPQALIRVEGTERFKISINKKDGSSVRICEFTNTDLRPLIQNDAVTVKALGNGVALLTVTQIGKVCQYHR